MDHHLHVNGHGTGTGLLSWITALVMGIVIFICLVVSFPLLVQPWLRSPIVLSFLKTFRIFCFNCLQLFIFTDIQNFKIRFLYVHSQTFIETLNDRHYDMTLKNFMQNSTYICNSENLCLTTWMLRAFTSKYLVWRCWYQPKVPKNLLLLNLLNWPDGIYLVANKSELMLPPRFFSQI